MSTMIRGFWGGMTVVMLLSLAACQQSYVHKKHWKKNAAPPVEVLEVEGADETSYVAEGLASWYGGKFHGRRTASGKRFNSKKMTAAHRSLPFGTKLRVTNLKNEKTIVVVVTDRGPFIQGRIIDLSHGAAKKLGFARAGVASVRLEQEL